MYELEKQLPLFARLEPREDEVTLAAIRWLAAPENAKELETFLFCAARHSVGEIVRENILRLCKTLQLPIPQQLQGWKIAQALMAKTGRAQNDWVKGFEQRLRENGIRAVRMKGLAYIHLAYKNPDLRKSSDTDLIIQDADLQRAEDILYELAAETGLDVDSSLDQSLTYVGYIREVNSHHVGYTLLQNGQRKLKLEFHRPVEFLSPMLLQPAYEQAISLPDGTLITHPVDTFLIACNHAWNHYPYSFPTFYYKPCMLRLYMDIFEMYRAVKALGYTDEELWIRAEQCHATDIMGNALHWTNLAYAAPYDGKTPPDLLPIAKPCHSYPCDLRTERLESTFVDQLFGREQERDRVASLYHAQPVREITVPQTEDPLHWLQTPKGEGITVDNQIGHTGFFDRHLTRTFCFTAPRLSATLHLCSDADALHFRIDLCGRFTPVKEDGVFDGNASHLLLTFWGNEGRTFVIHDGSSGPYMICTDYVREAFDSWPLPPLRREHTGDHTQAFYGSLPKKTLPNGEDIRFDFQLHWRGETPDQLQDMSFGGAMFGGTFYNMLEDSVPYLPRIVW